MHTITLRGVDHAAVERHISLARDRLLHSNPDRACLDAVLVKMRASTTLVLARLEVFCLIRALRDRRTALRIDMEALEERRLRGGVDGTLDAAWRALETDAMLLEEVRRRLWDVI